MREVTSFSVTHFSKAFFQLLLLMPVSAYALEVSPPLLASRAVHGGPAIGPCDGPQLSATGRFLAFYCISSDVVAGDDNDRFDTFLLDRQNSTVRRVSLNAANQEQRNHSSVGYPSLDGSQVVFSAQGMFHPDVVWVPDTIPDATTAHVFLRDFPSATTSLLSRSSSGEGNPEWVGARLWSALPDRHEIVFGSRADYVGFGSPLPHAISELFLRNWGTGVVERISARPDGGRSNAIATTADLAADGRYVVFLSRATDLTNDNPLALNQIYLRDRVTRATTRLTRPWHGGEFDLAALPLFRDPKISADGRYVLYSVSFSDEITPDDNPGVDDVYLLDRQRGKTEQVTRTHNGQPADGGSSVGDMSADARYIAYFTVASNHLPGPPQATGVFVLDRLTGEQVSVTASLPPKRPSFTPLMDLSQDGSTLAFSWLTDDPSRPDIRGRVLVYTVDITGGGQANEGAVQIPATSRSALMSLAFLLGLAGMVAALWRQRVISR